MKITNYKSLSELYNIATKKAEEREKLQKPAPIEEVTKEVLEDYLKGRNVNIEV